MKKQIIVTIVLFASLIHTQNTNTIPDLFTALTGKRLCAYIALPLGTCIFGCSVYIPKVLNKFSKDHPHMINSFKNQYNIDAQVHFCIYSGLGLIVASAVGIYFFDRKIQANKKYKVEIS